MLENPTQTVNDMSYFSCLDSVMENSKVSQEQSRRVEVGEGWGGLGKYVRANLTKGKVLPPSLLTWWNLVSSESGAFDANRR